MLDGDSGLSPRTARNCWQKIMCRPATDLGKARAAPVARSPLSLGLRAAHWTCQRKPTAWLESETGIMRGLPPHRFCTWQLRGINRRTKGCLAPDPRGGCSARVQSTVSSAKASSSVLFLFPLISDSWNGTPPNIFVRNPGLLRRPGSERGSGRFDQHHLLIHILGREFSVTLYLQG